MESMQNNEHDPMESYRRLLNSMDDSALEKTLDELQEEFATLSHSPVFSNSFIDLTDLKTFKAELNPRVKLAEVEQKIAVLQQEMERRGILETA